MVKLSEDNFLILDVIDVLGLNDFVLFHRFDSVLAGGVRAEPADFDETKGT